MYNNRTNIKIKLDDKVLEKVNQVDAAVAAVDKLYDDFDIFEDQVNTEVSRFEDQVNTEVDRFENQITTELDQYEDHINAEIDQYEERVDGKIEDIDNRKQDTLIAGNYITIDKDSEGRPVISSIGGTWDDIENKPTVNNVLLEGGLNYTTEDLGIIKADGAFYDEEGRVTPGKKYWYMSYDINAILRLYDSEGEPLIEDIIKYLIKDDDGTPIAYDFGKGGGGGGGGGDTEIKILPVNIPTTVSLGTECKATINWSSTKDEVPTGPGSLSVLVNSRTVYTRNNVPQGDVTVDLTNYLVSGTNKVSFVITDAYDNKSRFVALINAIEIKLESTFDPDRVYTGLINYTYTPTASVSKTMYFIVDGELYGTEVVTVSGEQQTYQIKNLSHGDHTLDVYFTCIVDEAEVKSNTLSYDLMFEIPGDTTPIITSTFNALEQEQYVAFNIPYRVYSPGYNYSNIQLIINGEVVQTLTVSQDTQYWEYRSDVAGMFNMVIKTGDVEKSFNIHVAESEIDVQPVTANLALALTSYGRSNAEEHPEIWRDADRHINCTLSNFNFTSDGWVKDNDGNTVLRVSGDARVEIPYKPFAADFRSLGKTIEIEFATSVVMNYESTIISCWSGDRGFYITPQLAKIKSQQSELQTQYKEDDHVRLSFVVEKRSENRLILMYINGIMSGAYQYPDGDNFRQMDPVNISLGSNDATLDIYNIRIYDSNLNRKQVVNNWIADTQSGSLRADRYFNNDVFNEAGDVVASKLPATTPYIIWDIDPLPQYKGDKRKGQAYFTDEIDPSRSFKLPLDDAGKPTGEYNVQGTSSAVYPVKNIRLKSKKGFVNDAGVVNKLFYITPDGIGANYFTYKVDYASSESANNVELVKLYNDASKAIGVLTPPQRQDPKVRVGIDGFPIVAFHRDSKGIDTFETKANFNNDKANEDVYGFAEGDESWEITNNSADEAKFLKPVTPESLANAFEIRYPDEDGYSDISKLGPMSAWVCSTNPDQATGNELEYPISFIYTEVVRAEDGSYSTRTVTTDEYTNDTREYRLSKFKAELKDWFNVNSTIFYYIFTSLFLMVDSRAKNAFPTYFASREPGDGGDHWYWLPYDMDTALGINNEGKLIFDYSLEDTDQFEGADVYNGQNSVLWCNLRTMFDGEIGQMYSELRKAGNFINFDETEARFTTHQAAWSENVFNEDSYKKYILPLIDKGDNYLEMLQGSKAEQRRWWLYNRFRYFDSKYLAGDSRTDVLQFRAYAVADITITPYADVYATVSYMNGAAGTVSARAHRDEPVTLHNPLSYANDQETYIYSASQLKSVGDLSPFRPDTVKAANAVKLQELKIGDGDPSYVNPNLKELTLGRNTLLTKLDVRNCVNLTQTVDISNCTNIEEIYFDGTRITGLILPSGGIVKTLHLPNTLTNVTIRNQPALSDLRIAGTELVQTLWLENIPSEVIDAKTIIMDMQPGAAVRLIGFEESVSDVQEIRDLYDLLDTMTGINAQGEDVPKAQVNGRIYIDDIKYEDYASLMSRYVDIQIIANHIWCTVKFINDGEEYNTQIVDRGHAATAPADPTKEPTAQYYYTFEGWDQEFDNVQTDMNINAVYEEHIQVYEIKFDTQTTKVSVDSQFVEYGQKVVRPEDPYIEGTTFDGWFEESQCINLYNFDTLVTGPRTLYAKWTDTDAPSVNIGRMTFNSFEFEITDNIAVVKYAITGSGTEPTEWINIQPTEKYSGEFTVRSAGTYYVWGSDAAGRTVNSYIIAYPINKNVTPGASIEVYEDSTLVGNFALHDTELRIYASKDSHYDDLKLYLDGELLEDVSVDTIADREISLEATCVPHVYTVQFDIGEYGTPVDDQHITYLHKATQPYNQFVEKHIIDGWYKEPELLNKWNFDVDIVVRDITLYAKWIEYVKPTNIKVLVGENRDFVVNVYQPVADSVKVVWGDSPLEETMSQTGQVQFTHTYASEGEYTIGITCTESGFLLGSDFSNQVVMPISSVTEIEFALNVAYTNLYAFKGATNLQELNLTDYMTEVAIGAFQGCSGLESIIIPDNITVINNFAFQDCTAIEGEVELPNTLTRLGQQAFYNCKNVTKFDIPDSLGDIGNSAFFGCSALEEFHVPSSLTVLHSSLLGDCKSLISIDIPETVNALEDRVFVGCSNLEKVIIRNRNLVTGQLNFNLCPKLQSAGPIGGDYNIEFAWDTVIPAYSLSYGFNQSALKVIDLPDGLEEIGESAFSNCLDVKQLVLPDSLVRIGERAFTRMSSLIELIIPASVETIGNNACDFCTSLRDVYLKNIKSDNKIETYAASWFTNCYASRVLAHVPLVLDTDEATRLAYGQFWTFTNATSAINYINDIE